MTANIPDYNNRQLARYIMGRREGGEMQSQTNQ